MKIIHPASCSVTRMEMLFHDIHLSWATGFLFSYGQTLSLVSNWHVFSGRHPETKIPLKSNGCTPNRVKFHLSVGAHEPQGNFSIHSRPMVLPTVSDSQALWWQHRGYLDTTTGEPRHVDIGVLPLTEAIDDFDEIKNLIQSFGAHVLVNTAGNVEEWTIRQGTARVGSEVFILGYPRGLANQGPFPIWKRGSLASEPLFNIEGNIPIIYVDALTREGMSGSPVLYFGPEIINQQGIPSGPPRSSKDQPWLIGVYAGRTGASEDELDMALGRVWKRALLDEIFVQRVPGGHPPMPPSKERRQC
jgi:hypothetical protein